MVPVWSLARYPTRYRLGVGYRTVGRDYLSSIGEVIVKPLEFCTVDTDGSQLFLENDRVYSVKSFLLVQEYGTCDEAVLGLVVQVVCHVDQGCGR